MSRLVIWAGGTPAFSPQGQGGVPQAAGTPGQGGGEAGVQGQGAGGVPGAAAHRLAEQAAAPGNSRPSGAVPWQPAQSFTRMRQQLPLPVRGTELAVGASRTLED